VKRELEKGVVKSLRYEALETRGHSVDAGACQDLIFNIPLLHEIDIRLSSCDHVAGRTDGMAGPSSSSSSLLLLLVLVLEGELVIYQRSRQPVEAYCADEWYM